MKALKALPDDPIRHNRRDFQNSVAEREQLFRRSLYPFVLNQKASQVLQHVDDIAMGTIAADSFGIKNGADNRLHTFIRLDRPQTRVVGSIAHPTTDFIIEGELFAVLFGDR